MIVLNLFRKVKIQCLPLGSYSIILSSVLILFAIFSCQHETSSSSQTRIGYKTNFEKTLNIKVPQWQEEYKVPAVAIGVIENGKVRFSKVFGEHKVGYKAPQNTIFNVASLTKPMVSTATLRLIDDDNWSLDEPLQNYWIDPDLQGDSLALQLNTRHVLSHTTGFLNWRRMHPTKKLSFDFKPGTKYQYSGEGFEYLANALRKKFGTKLEPLIDSLVFKPFKMKDAHLSWLKAKDTARFAHWYDVRGNEHSEYYKTHWVSAADDLLVTIDDLNNFGLSIMNEELLSKELFQEMVTPQSKIHNNASYGLGWTLVENLSNGEYLINHDGGDVGVAATMIFLPKSKNGIVVLTNADNGSILCKKVIKESMIIGDEIIERIYWGGKIPEVIQVSNNLLAEYAGEYMSSLGRTIRFLKKENSLLIDGAGIPQLTLFPKTENTFFPKDFEIEFVFKRNNEGIVDSFTLIQGEKETMTGQKIK